MDGSDTRLSNRGGVIPSAVPIYWEDLLDPVKKTFKPASDLRALFERHGIRASDEVIAYCWVGHLVGGGFVRAAPDRLQTAPELPGLLGGMESPQGSAYGSLRQMRLNRHVRSVTSPDNRNRLRCPMCRHVRTYADMTPSTGRCGSAKPITF